MTGAIIDQLDDRQRVLREVQAPEQVKPASDKPGGWRVSSGAFSFGDDNSVSVDLEQSLVRAGLDIRSRYPSLDRAVALVAHPVRRFTSSGMTVQHTPIEGNDHHGSIRAPNLTVSKRKSIARKLADTCELIEPINVAEVLRQVTLKAEKAKFAKPTA